MAIKVRVPTPLRTLTSGKSDVSADGENVAALIKDLETNYPGMANRILEDNGEVRRFVNLFVNGEDIRFLEGIQTAVKAGDELSIVPAMAGGA
ncbi:MAG: sulfur-carrier protein [Chloroflexota bacterium]|jgi:molybdopterin synthase sulfur carrier subunit|nr:sulfur-carrier protein [Chloroflexota bacterium]